MLYELRHYRAADNSSLGALVNWFGTDVMPAWQTQEIRIVGCWTVAIGQQPRFTALLAFEDANQRMEQMSALRQSANWQEIIGRSYTGNGSMIANIDTMLLTPTPYSPDPFQFINAEKPGVFEERVYRGVGGREYAAINRRFNDHTCRIFARHGIVPVGFWNVEVGPDQPSLYYLVRFDDLSEYNPKWGAFRADPEWQQVRAESERNGNIVQRISSMILTPTPFSPMR